jgi:hypothetical protein
VRPAQRQLVGLGEPLSGEEGGTGIGDGDVVTKKAGMLGEGLGYVNGAEDDQARAGDYRFDEDVAVPVGDGGGHLPLDEHPSICCRRLDHLGRESPGDDPRLGVEDGSLTEAGPGDHRHPRPEPLLFGQATQRLQLAVAHHGSTNTWIVPPQASPTSKASSSEMP